MKRARLLLCGLMIICYSALVAQERKVSVYVFLGPECPISQQCTLELGQLYQAYGQKGIAFIGVVPGTLYTQAEVEEFKTTYNIAFPMVRDTAYEVTERLKATITPQAIVMDARNDVLYSGAIDNSYLALGKKNNHVSAEYLRDALDAVVAGKVVAVKNTSPVGCRIEGNGRHGARL